MRRLVVSLILALLSVSSRTYASDLEQQLRSQYQGKTLLLRGFPSGDSLVYRSDGDLVKYEPPGDWTADGFILVEELHISGDRLLIDGTRLLAIRSDKGLRLSSAEQPGSQKDQTKPTRVRIEADFGPSPPSTEQAKAVLAKIFLTESDNLALLVPSYWRQCVWDALEGKNPNCRFSPEISAVPGIRLTQPAAAGSPTPSRSSPEPTPSPGLDDSVGILTQRTYHNGGGVTPPKLLHSPQPEFNNAARGIKYQGVVSLGVVIDKDGSPKKIRILSPLGAGLDAKAVEVVNTWKFQPAYKDGNPVPFEIAIEIDFHLF